MIVETENFASSQVSPFALEEYILCTSQHVLIRSLILDFSVFTNFCHLSGICSQQTLSELIS